ncbi:hypothetical protein Q0590_00005 [Rhodocytophaga aerolata]|uniref:Uncharacterized protein n=1 Tax=Rhodocytophaga aerolata TaxID=455078 RepID=A0ABT8QXN4_9BACT|nr:hypothetical protein [Rhodocytophaga aerolata]MDO1444606.1 hypothetical protein [Rhodocytophaga aerolata]
MGFTILNDQPAAHDQFYFWAYRDIDIAVLTDDDSGQYYVYSIARAIEILRCRYPKAYQKLFMESRVFSTQAPKPGTFINRYSKILISFNNNTKASIAESGTVLGTNEDPSGAFGKYSNLAVISFHQANLLGSTNQGSKVLYDKSPDENYIRYLREGIVETLLHEMLHRYIETRRNIDELATTVVSARPNKVSTA